MIKELVGVVTTFFVMLPFLLLNRNIFKINDKNKFAFLFLVINTIQGAFLLLLAYGLFIVGQKCLIGMIIVFTVYLFLFLVLLFTHRRRVAKLEEEKEIKEVTEEDLADIIFQEELFQTQKLARTQSVIDNIKEEMEDSANENILEEDQCTMLVEEPDFSKIEKEEILRTLDDIFKEI